MRPWPAARGVKKTATPEEAAANMSCFLISTFPLKEGDWHEIRIVNRAGCVL